MPNAAHQPCQDLNGVKVATISVISEYQQIFSVLLFTGVAFGDLLLFVVLYILQHFYAFYVTTNMMNMLFSSV